MNITDVKILRMGAPYRDSNWIFVKIETDSGIYGLGEGGLKYKDAAVMAELGEFKRWLIGQDSFQIEFIWNTLYRQNWTGGPVTMSAISAIDLALHDIKGKALGVPVYELMGGKVRDSVTLYANSWFGGAKTPSQFARKAKSVVKQGYKGLKFYPFNGPQVATPARINRGIALVNAVRNAIGPEVELAVDVRGQLNIGSAIRVAHKLEAYDIAWLEEPILFDNIDALQALGGAVNVAIATGEQLYGRWEFRGLLEKNIVRIIQPDICHTGGISELRKIAAMAETYFVTVAPHNAVGPIGTIASLHTDMCVPNFLTQEIMLNNLPLYNELLTNPIVIEEGSAKVPNGPGWGTDIDEDIVQAYPPHDYSPINRRMSYY